MLAFKPKQDPLLTRIAKSGLFQFMMVVILGLGVTWFVIRTDRPQKWIQRINRFASVAPNPTAPTAQSTEAGIAEDSADLEAPPAAASAWAARSMVASAPGATANLGTSSASATLSTSSINPVSATQSINVALMMTETETEYLNSIMQKAFAANSIIRDDDIKIFIEPRAEPHTSPSSKILLELNQAVRKSYGNTNRGFSISMTLLAVNTNSYLIRLQFNKTHPNDNLQFPVEFSLRKGERLYVTGHPLLSYFEFENDLVNVDPFTILKSPDYRNQKTTFAIVVELQ